MKEKVRKVLQTNEKVSRNEALKLKSHQKDKHLGSLPCKILGTILKTYERGTQTKCPEDKKVDDAQGFTSKR